MLNINIPLELETMEAIQLIESPVVESLGILFMGENMNVGMPTIRVYELEKIKDAFEIKNELQAFTFQSAEEAMMFVKRLPGMSALELLLMMNSVNENTNVH